MNDILVSSYLYTTIYHKKLDFTDKFHGLIHFKNVTENIKFLLKNLNLTETKLIELCILAGYYHDIGRIVEDKGHELQSATMFMDYAELSPTVSSGLSKLDIIEVYNAILYHNWRDTPSNDIGRILQDADKLDFYDLDRLEVATKLQRKEVFNLYDKIHYKLNYNISKQLFEEKYLTAIERYSQII